jgi:predicted dehydrogenase
MPHHMNNKMWLVGPGLMGIEYAKVLQAQDVPFEVIGRGARSAAFFTNTTGVPVHQGGVQLALHQATQIPDAVIVAVSAEELAEAALLLLRNGVRKILLEKPAGITLDEIVRIADEAEKQEAEVYVAYNRRFYASTLKAQSIIAEDSGVTSFTFEFTEWSHQIVDLEKDPRVKRNWFLANSTHVVDLAFHLGGVPKRICCYQSGGLKWHPSASVFTGAGVTKGGALFSYHANWEAPGRWKVEILTRKHRLIFCPLEKLQVQEIGSTTIEEVKLENELDLKFKPGLFRQVEAFLTEENSDMLATIASHKDMAQRVFCKMANQEK